MTGKRTLQALAEGTAWVGLAIGVALALLRLPHANLSLVFLGAVLIVAVRRGLWPSLYASVLAFLAFNYLFTPPFRTFEVEAQGDFATLVFFLAMAALGANLAARAREEMTKKEAALDRISNLFDFSRRLAAAARADDVLGILAGELSRALDCGVVALAPTGGALRVRATSDRLGISPQAVDMEAAARAWAGQGEEKGAGRWLFLPLDTASARVGLVGLTLVRLDGTRAELTASLCGQAAIAVERTELAEHLEEARLISETEQLRSALLSSVSHDLRTPLASVIGSASSLLEYGANLGEEDRRELLQTVLEESERLDRHIQNLLDMTRLGQGDIGLRRDWVDLNDLVSGATRRLHSGLSGLDVTVRVSPEAAILYVHGALLEQALVNLLDNAARFSRPGGRIEVRGRREEDLVVVEVIDEGPGIPEVEREKVFEMFYSSPGRDRRARGTGLGLAICRGLVGAHGGAVAALEGPHGVGACVRVTLPVTWSACDGGELR